MAFILFACIESPATEGNYDVPEKDFETYKKKRDMLRENNNQRWVYARMVKISTDFSYKN